MNDPVASIVARRLLELSEQPTTAQVLAVAVGIAREAFEAGERRGFDRGYLAAQEQYVRVQMLLTETMGVA